MSAVKSIFCVPKTFLENFISAFRNFHKNMLLFSKNLRNIVLHADMPETSLIFPLPWIMTNPSCASHAFPRLLIPETKINCWITLKEEETNKKKKRIAGAKHTPSRVKEKTRCEAILVSRAGFTTKADNLKHHWDCTATITQREINASLMWDAQCHLRELAGANYHHHGSRRVWRKALVCAVASPISPEKLEKPR